ncbi:MAG: hypothetical protein M3Y58_12110, partial [Chloroflexota bacterium]|nr:hypothetical protein [Chloroflexota bacterium]
MILDTRLGNTPRWFLTPPKDYTMRVPDEIRECVVFLGVVVTGETGRIERRLLGTAFIIAMPAQDPSVSHAYLVTAAHLLDKIGVNQFFIRANTVSGDADYIYGRLDSPETRWWLHPTNPKNVDIAVMDCALPSDKWSLRAIPATMFLSEDVIAERNIG